MNAQAILAAAYAQLKRGDPLGAEVKLAELWNAGPPPPPAAVHLLGLIRRAQGRIGEAELLMRQSIEAEPQNGEYHNNLGLLLFNAGHVEPALASFDAALAANAGLDPAALNRARALDALGRHADAEAAARALTARKPTAAVWTVLGGALRQQHRLDDALAAFDRALAMDPRHVGARHDRAVALELAGRSEEAVDIYARLHGEGLAAPALFLNWANALKNLGRNDEAEQRLAEGVARHPADAQLHAALAKMRWLTGAGGDFARDFLAAVRARPADLVLRLGCADMLRRADRHAEADDLLAEGLTQSADDPLLLSARGVVKSEMGDAAGALVLLERAAALRPEDFNLREGLVTALMQNGRAREALPLIASARAARPLDSAWLAQEALALRLTGDPAYAGLYDFARLVRPYDLATPAGYASFAAFNDELAQALRALHTLDAHPLDQSLRNGTQTARSLLESDDPLIRTFLQLLEAPIADYIATMPDDPTHPIYGRKPTSGRGKLVGCWSVRLRPGGFHVNHVHPEGWISSAYYVSVPPGVAGANDRQGWIQFGAPRWPIPGAEAEHFVEPRPGRLVLFPSCMWHGTVPFRKGEERLTIAFDVAPA
jgi:uncharacterized protein (TIGR02466 family)